MRAARSRRHLLLGMAAAAAMPALARADGRGRDGFDVDIRGDLPLRLIGPDGGRYRPRRLVVLERGGARAATLPHAADFEGVARLPAARLPLVGPIFGDVPAAHFVRPENRLAPLFRVGEDAVIDLRSAAPGAAAAVTDRLGASIQVLTRDRRAGVVELGLPANLRFAPVSVRASALTPLGAVYDRGERLLLAPPYEALFGARLF